MSWTQLCGPYKRFILLRCYAASYRSNFGRGSRQRRGGEFMDRRPWTILLSPRSVASSCNNKFRFHRESTQLLFSLPLPQTTAKAAAKWKLIYFNVSGEVEKRSSSSRKKVKSRERWEDAGRRNDLKIVQGGKFSIFYSSSIQHFALRCPSFVETTPPIEVQ